MAKIGEFGLHFDRSVEIRSASEVDDLFKEEDIDASVGETTVKTAASKPQRPGKGRAKVAKFTADE
jgi:hypothetical protein